MSMEEEIEAKEVYENQVELKYDFYNSGIEFYNDKKEEIVNEEQEDKILHT